MDPHDTEISAQIVNRRGEECEKEIKTALSRLFPPSQNPQVFEST